MDLQSYNAHCGALPATTTVVQWGGAHVWKVGGKVFAVAWGQETSAPHAQACGPDAPRGAPSDGAQMSHHQFHAEGDGFEVSFKVTPDQFILLNELPGVRPAPYMASRGLKWVQRFGPQTLSDEDVCAYLTASHGLVAAGLTKKLRRELGLEC
ncbi:MAG: MmcQ/YjbR family DNA-binding protein [Pseudomonadota bacterium]